MVQQADNPPGQWEVNISILRNPLLWFQLVMVALLSSSYLLLLLLGLNLFESQWEDIPASFAVALSVASGLFLAFSLILFLVYWRGIPTRYVLGDNLIEQHTLMRGKKTAGLFSLFGIISGKSAGYTAAGATLLAHSREQIAVKWRDVSSIDASPKRREIQLSDDWHTTMQVICPTDDFDDILQFIQQKTEKYIRTDGQAEVQKTPFASKVILSIFVLVFGFFLFPRLPIHFIGFFTITMIVLAMLSLWSEGLKQRIYGAVLFLLPWIGVGLAYFFNEIEMHRAGAIYALAVELVFLVFFVLLGLGVALKHVR